MNTEEKAWELEHAYLERATPWEWHLYAAKSDFDHNCWGLRWLVDNPRLDEATARFLFWYLGAGFFAQYANEEEAPTGQKDDYALVRLLEERILAHFYQPAQIHFDPKNSTLILPEATQCVDSRWIIPDELFKPVGTENVEFDYTPGYEGGLPQQLNKALQELFETQSNQEFIE